MNDPTIWDPPVINEFISPMNTVISIINHSEIGVLFGIFLRMKIHPKILVNISKALGNHKEEVNINYESSTK